MSTIVKNKKNVSKRGRYPHKRDRVILALKEQRMATSSDLGVSTQYLATLVERGIVEVRTQRKCEERGRPANVYGLSARGRGFAMNLTKRQKRNA